jgi:hypothetical protein
MGLPSMFHMTILVCLAVTYPLALNNQSHGLAVVMAENVLLSDSISYSLQDTGQGMKHVHLLESTRPCKGFRHKFNPKCRIGWVAA